MKNFKNFVISILKKELTQTEKAIDNMLNAIQQGIITKSTKQRLADLEDRKQDIEISIAKEQIQNPLLTKKQLHFLFDKIKQFDLTKVEQRQKLIDIFVNCIIVYDDHIKFFFNYKERTETITFDELNNCSVLSDSPRPLEPQYVVVLLFYNLATLQYIETTTHYKTPLDHISDHNGKYFRQKY